MRKYVITNTNFKTVNIQPYQLVHKMTVCGDLTVWTTNEKNIIIITNDTFKDGEWVSGSEVYSEVACYVGMREA